MARNVGSIADLKKLLEAREKELAKLASKRKKLVAQLGKLDKQIADVKGRAAVRRRRAVAKARPGRPRGRRRKKTLKQAAGEILGATRKALGAKDIIAALPTVGYQSASKNLMTMVGSLLSRTPEFRRVSRGKYRLRRARGRPAKKAAGATKAQTTSKGT